MQCNFIQGLNVNILHIEWVLKNIDQTTYTYLLGNHLPIISDLTGGVKSGSKQLKQWKSEQVKENVTPKRKSSSPAANTDAKKTRQVKDTPASNNDVYSPVQDNYRKDHVAFHQKVSYSHSNPSRSKQIILIKM